MCKASSYLGVILSIVVATAVTMFIASIILKASKGTEEDLEEAQEQMKDMKNTNQEVKSVSYHELRKIVFACDAGMGSSAMGAALLTKKLKAAGIDIEVPHYAINGYPRRFSSGVTHVSLVITCTGKTSKGRDFPITNFMGGTEYDEIVKKLQ